MSLSVRSFISAASLCLLFSGEAAAAGFLVNTTADTTTGGLTSGSLRDAINAANSGDCASPCTITFDASLIGQEILIDSALPSLDAPGANGTVIDGPGATSLAIRNNGALTSSSALNISAAGVTVRNLSIYGFENHIFVYGLNTTIANNQIGLNAAKTPHAYTGSQRSGIYTFSSAPGSLFEGNTIGMMMGSAGTGIYSAGGNDITIRGNDIGTDDLETAFGNVYGIYLASSSGFLIEGNRIAHNTEGIRVAGATALRNAFHANSFFQNSIGIEIGTSFNDFGDEDSGLANNGQNFPEIYEPVISGSTIRAIVYVDSAAVSSTASLLVELYDVDQSTFNQGKVFLGSQCFPGNLVEDQSMEVPAGTAGEGSYILGTATSYTSGDCSPGTVNDGTSEFSWLAYLNAGIVVNTTADTPEAEFTTLRKAIELANSGDCFAPCSIEFDIPVSDAGYDSSAGTFTIRPLSPLPEILADDVYINGGSQRERSGIDNPNGPEIVINGSLAGVSHGLFIRGHWSAVREVVIQGFQGDGILAVALPVDEYMSGLYVESSYIGTNASGTAAVPNLGNGISLLDFNDFAQIGYGDDGNLISGNGGAGIYLGPNSYGADLESNRIGTSTDGLSPIPNEGGGIIVSGNYHFIGGSGFVAEGFDSSLAAASIVEKRTRTAESLEERHPELAPAKRGSLPRPRAHSTAQIAQRDTSEGRRRVVAPPASVTASSEIIPLTSGNLIAFNTGHGIFIDQALGTAIYWNSIHSNSGDGVHLTPDAGIGHDISSNSIHSNALLGIDLGGDGVTPNDGLETVGPNSYIDYPVIQRAYWDGFSTIIEGTYQGADVEAEYEIGFFSSVMPDPSGYGEGETFHRNDWLFSGPFVTSVGENLSNRWITSTATGEDGGCCYWNTSEFSQAVQVLPLDVSVAKSGPAGLAAGSTANWTLEIKNLSGLDAEGLQVVDELPAGVSNVNYSAPGWSCSLAGTTLTCDLASLASEATSSISISATAPGSGASMTNQATLTTVSTDENSANNSSSVTTTLLYADLNISKSSNPSTVKAGDAYQYDILVGNGGSVAAQTVEVVDVLPATVSYTGFGGVGWSCTEFSGTVTCVRNAGELSPGASALLTLHVIAPMTSGTLINNVSVAGTPEANTTNNSASASTSINSPPVAVNDSATTVENTAVSLNVLANDSDPDGDTLTLVSNTGSSNGTVSCAANGDCTFTPNAGFTGTASFGYTISDGFLTASASVTITVTPGNEAPVAANDSVSTHFQTPVSFNVLANDTDPDGDALTLVSNTSPSNGAVSCAPSGDCTYTPNAGFGGSDSFSYTISDGALTSSATVTISVACPAGQPIPVRPTLGETNLPSPVTFVWRAVEDAISYEVFIIDQGALASVGSISSSAPAGSEVSLTVPVEKRGQIIWLVRVFFGEECPTVDGPTSVFSRTECPSGVATPIEPRASTLIERSLTTFRWTEVSGADHYVVYLSINGATPTPAAQVPASPTPEVEIVLPAGVTL
ncbi:MAG TPA: Ig-like domain-containing protein, partial [Thermoanaerobaculia bacterium]|nr:Ig-like domain-containing protein [Thermoanaerobaculia bacterium]